MSMNNPYEVYQQNSINTASPGEITLMLYNGCLKFIKQAILAVQHTDSKAKNINIQKAQKIITELMITLNMDQEVSKNMSTMYEYINQRLREANLKDDISILKEVEEHVTAFRDTWKQVIQITRKKQHGQIGQA